MKQWRHGTSELELRKGRSSCKCIKPNMGFTRWRCEYTRHLEQPEFLKAEHAADRVFLAKKLAGGFFAEHNTVSRSKRRSLVAPFQPETKYAKKCFVGKCSGY